LKNVYPAGQSFPKLALIRSLLLAFLLILSSSAGLFTPDFYSAETKNWQAQSIGQDLVDLLLIAPFLILYFKPKTDHEPG
jgi:hypothetical protein